MTLPLSRPVFDARIGSNSFGDLPDWDLTDLYESPDCTAIKSDFARVETDVRSFEADFKGKLANLTAAQMLECVRRYELIDIIAGRIMSYAGLRYYQNTMDWSAPNSLPTHRMPSPRPPRRWCFSPSNSTVSRNPR